MNGQPITRKSSDPYGEVSAERIEELLRIKANLAADLGAAQDALSTTVEELSAAQTALAAATTGSASLAAVRDLLLSELIQAREFIRVEIPHRPTLAHLDEVIDRILPPVDIHDLPWFAKVLAESRASLEASYAHNPDNVPTWYREFRTAEITAEATARLAATYAVSPGSATAWYRENREAKTSGLTE